MIQKSKRAYKAWFKRVVEHLTAQCSRCEVITKNLNFIIQDQYGREIAAFCGTCSNNDSNMIDGQEVK